MSDEAGPTFEEIRNGYVTIKKAEYERLIAAARERDALLAAASQILTRYEQLEGACDCFQQSSEVANAEADEAQRESTELRAELARLREQKLRVVGRLWNAVATSNDDRHSPIVLGDMLRRVEQLAAENDRLREALTEIRDCCADRERVVMIGVRLFAGIESVAARALDPNPPEGE